MNPARNAPRSATAPGDDIPAARPGPTPQYVTNLLGVGTFLALFSNQAMYIILPVNTAAAAILPADVGLMLAANRIVRIFLNGPGGLLIERVSRRKVLLAAQAFGILASLLYLLTGFWPLLAGRLSWGIAWVGLWIAGNAAILDVAPARKRGGISGRFHMWLFAGYGGGALCGGLLNDWLGYSRAFIVFAALGLLALLLWWRQLPETRASQVTGHSAHAKLLKFQLEQPAPLRLLPLLTAMLLVALNWLIFLGIITATLTLLLQEKIGSGILLGALWLPLTTLSGFTSAAINMLSMVTSPFAGALSDRLGYRWPTILFALLLGSVSLALAARAPGLLVLAGILPAAITNGILQTQTTALIGDLIQSARRPRMLGWFTTLGDVGSASGSLLAFGLIAAGWSLAQVLLLMAALLAAMLLWTFFVARRERGTPVAL